MQRLMHIADEMNEVAYRFSALQRIGGLLFQDGALFFNRARHTSFGAAVAVQLPLVFPPWNIDVIPGTILALVAHITRPARSLHYPRIVCHAPPDAHFLAPLLSA